MAADDSRPGVQPAQWLSDGLYDVIVVEADGGESDSDGVEAVHDVSVDADGGDHRCRVELVITAGEIKGEVVELTIAAVDLDPIELLGLPGVLEVAGGEPRFLLS